MSDLYEIRVEERLEADLEAIVSDAVAHGLSADAVRRIVAGSEGPYVVCTLRVHRGHPDADPLDTPTVGLMHNLLADCSEPLMEALGGGDAVNNPKFVPRPATAKVAYAVLDATPERQRLRLWTAAAFAPELDRPYSSAAWAIDRARLDRRKPWPDMRRFPPPGLAGEIEIGRSGSAIAKSFAPLFDHKQFKKKGIEVAGAQCIGASIYLLADVGGHVLVLEPPYKALRVLGQAPREQAKLRFTALAVRRGRLLGQDESGGWTEVDPETGARSTGTPAELPSATPLAATSGHQSARIDARGLLTVERAGDEPVEIPTGLRSPIALLSTPAEDTWLVSTAHDSYLVHAPTRTIALQLGGSARHVFAVPKPRSLVLVCPGSVQIAKFVR